MANAKTRQRLNALFADMERLAADPKASQDDIRCELDSLRARLLELEAQIKESEALLAEIAPESHQGTVEPVQPIQRPTYQLVYEKEQVGYAFSRGRLEPLQEASLSGLDAMTAIHTPLVDTGKPVGAIVVEANPNQPWSQDEDSLAEAIARQASLQIQNLRLLAAAERARAEAQAATRRYAHESWQNFMDAIHESERIAFAYDQSAVVPCTEETPPDVDIVETVDVLDEHIGRLFLKSSPGQPLTDSDRQMVSAVARQVSQQVENLRLLADASRSRAEAEEATRRMTRDSWQTYAEREEGALVGFVYDSIKVEPIVEDTAPMMDVALAEPLLVRGEPIGELAVAGGADLSPEARDLMAAIATQTSIHLETLRLNEELQKRARELQELDRLKSSFLANMSHELRTPLNSILGFSDVMLEEIDGPLTEYMINDLQLIQKNGKHLLHLINDVLDMAKIEAGRMNLHPEKFRLHEVLDEVTSITSTFASEKNLSLFIDPESDKEVEILADVTRIRQVVINMANNAIKFTEKGKVVLCAKKLDEEKVLITVKDTGLGIPETHLETVFQEFAQVDTSTTRKVGGTGLGLPISRKLVEMHGGRMWAESTGIPGEGSTFYVELYIEARITQTIEKVTK